MSNILQNWINPIYLDEYYIKNLKETVKSKPEIKYLVLDNFFIPKKIDNMIKEHESLTFTENLDRYSHDGTVLPYDSSVYWMTPKNYCYELLSSPFWFDYILNLFSMTKNKDCYTEVKLRKHRKDSNGFWIHTDSATRDIVFICYYNKNWTVEDGGILQLWKVDECNCENTLIVNGNYRDKMLFLNTSRLNTSSPGGGFEDNESHDLILIDQILPVYNRVFICDLKASPTYHSVTPTNSKERTGFVQWLYNNG